MKGVLLLARGHCDSDCVKSPEAPFFVRLVGRRAHEI